MTIPISNELAAEACSGFLKSVFDDVDILLNQRIPSVGLSQGLMMIRVKLNGRVMTGIAAIDMALFLWRFDVVCPVLSEEEDEVTFWCSGYESPMEEPFPITFYFSQSLEILEEFRLVEER